MHPFFIHSHGQVQSRCLNGNAEQRLTGRAGMGRRATASKWSRSASRAESPWFTGKRSVEDERKRRIGLGHCTDSVDGFSAVTRFCTALYRQRLGRIAARRHFSTKKQGARSVSRALRLMTNPASRLLRRHRLIFGKISPHGKAQKSVAALLSVSLGCFAAKGNAPSGQPSAG